MSPSSLLKMHWMVVETSRLATRHLLSEDEGGCDFEGLTDYRMGLHIGAVFILLGVSLLGAFAPMFLNFIRHPAVRAGLKIGTFFAFGTVLATGFIHMLQPANEALTSPCLPESWNNSYEAYAYLFCVLAILFMHAVDYGTRQWQCRMGNMVDETPQLQQNPCCDIDRALDLEAPRQAEGAPAAPASEKETSIKAPADTSDDLDHDHDHHNALGKATAVYLMEAGIVFHSVVIGITLGVTTGSSFTTLLIVLSFHQFFEGFAIGFTAVDARLNKLRLAIVGIVYALTTPIGVAIGIGIRTTYNENSEDALFVQGIFDSISAGILIYVALVQLITPQFTTNRWLGRQVWWVKLLSFAALYAGVAVMALIGKWA